MIVSKGRGYPETIIIIFSVNSQGDGMLFTAVFK